MYTSSYLLTTWTMILKYYILNEISRNPSKGLLHPQTMKCTCIIDRNLHANLKDALLLSEPAEEVQEHVYVASSPSVVGSMVRVPFTAIWDLPEDTTSSEPLYHLKEAPVCVIIEQLKVALPPSAIKTSLGSSSKAV